MKDLNSKEIGERIRNVRLSRSLTQERLAEAVDCTPSYVSSIENGYYIPALNTICKICEFLDISLDYIVNGKMKNFNNQEKVFNLLSSEEWELLNAFISKVKE